MHALLERMHSFRLLFILGRKWISRLSAFVLMLFIGSTGAFAQASGADSDNLMRKGIGEWCYAPVGALTTAIRTSYIDLAVKNATKAQEKYGIPGALLAAMSITCFRASDPPLVT